VILAVEPEVICGLGAHTVTLVASDSAGREDRARTVVILCPEGEKGCERSPGDPKGAGGGPATAGLVCRWVTAFDLEPPEAEHDLNQKLYGAGGEPLESRDRAPLASSGAMEVWRTDRGPGPDHALAVLRTGANCSTPPTELSLSKGGTMQFRLNLICLDRQQRIVPCDGDVEVEGTYHGQAEAGTEAGPGCLGRPNRVHASAQDECAMSVNGTSVFGKGVSVQNGNTVSSTPTFGLDVGVAHGPTGLSANPSIRFGYSETNVQTTGKSQDSVEAFGNARTKLPLTVSLEARGHVEVQAHHRTWARANARMLACGFWLVAQTACPAPPVFVSQILGEGADRHHAERMSEQFRVTRLGF